LSKNGCTFTRVCGCYVDADHHKVTKISETFLNLDDEEFYKYLDIAKKVLSGTIGNNILELEFPLAEEAAGGRQQFLMGLRESKLKNEDLMDAFYDQVIENYDYVGNYLILVFHDVYDVITKTTDNDKLDESEEVYEYLLCAICPVNLTKPGLGYLADDNRIGPRIRDWVVGVPDTGFVFPAFTDRSSDIHSVMFYTRDTKTPHSEFMENGLGCNTRLTATEKKLTFQDIVRDVIGEDDDESDALYMDIHENIYDRIDIPVPENMEAEIAPLRDMIMEAVAETDDALMNKYFNGEEFTFDEIKKAIRQGVKDGTIYPVYCGTGQENVGIMSLMDGIGKYLQNPTEITEVSHDSKTGEPVEVVQDAADTTSAIVFKTIADPYVGKMSVFRVYSGSVKADSTLYNPNKDTYEKIGKIFTLTGKKQQDVPEIIAGDIGVVAKLDKTKTGDTLCAENKNIILSGIEFPAPVISMAVYPEAKGDEEKIVSGLTKLTDEDPTFTVTNNSETKQTLINGQGEQHIDVIVSKLKAKYGVNVKLEEPIVPYRETILG
ncbi:MAG: DUF4317 family protein, partial [Clostridia bacterium]|nr:DUF4317 family protein [Clostridia bacterium]